MAIRPFPIVSVLGISVSLTIVQSVKAGPTGLNGKPGTYASVIEETRQVGEQRIENSDVRATLSLENLRVLQLEWREAVTELYVDVTIEISDAGRFGNPQHQLEKKFRDIVAFRGDARYFQRWVPEMPDVQVTEDMQPDLRSAQWFRESPMRTTVYDGGDSKSVFAFPGTAQVEGGKRADIDGKIDFILQLFGSSLRPERRESAHYIPAALSHTELYSVQPTLEIVDGQPCHVVSSGFDTLWLDHQLGAALRRRVSFRRTSEKDDGALAQLLICRDFAQVDENFRYPTSAASYVFHTADADGRLGTVKQIQAFTLAEVRTSVPESLFVLEIPEGTYVADSVRGMAYIMPKGIELLDEAIARGVPLVKGRMEGVPGRAGGRLEGGSVRLWLIYANIAVIVFLIALFWARRRAAAKR